MVERYLYQKAQERVAGGNDVVMSEIRLHPSWKELLQEEFSKSYFSELIKFVKAEYALKTVYPPGSLIFNALDHTPPEEVKVVILGQDPYHGPGQANGLSFSVNDGIALPPSLKNILKEVSEDVGAPLPANGNLERWANQGVLLLNASLTVRAGEAGSHQNKGWEIFTDAVIKAINEHTRGVVFLLWGSFAQKKEALIDKAKHKILSAPHPSPLSAYRGFFGCRHFSSANAYLSSNGKQEIKW